MKLATAGRAFRRLFDSDDLPWLAPLPPWSEARDRQVREVRRAARTLKTTCRHLPCHPDTGARIERSTVPRWPEIIALALRAHEAVPDIDTLGWDVALPPGGPILIEVNLHWGVPVDLALGDTPYIEHLLQPSVARRLRA